MDRRSPLLLLLLLFLFSLALQQPGISHASSTSKFRCHAPERDALMELKQKLRDPSGRLSSWAGQDCCGWEGVRCSNVTGHVIQLDLRNRHILGYDYVDCSDETLHYWSHAEYGCKWALFGGISRSLLSLRHLRHLDLSGNFFQHKPIPEFLGSFTRLTYLNLSAAGFGGKVPDQLGNLSNLHDLDLSSNAVGDSYQSSSSLYIENAGWISQLTSLRHLNMEFVYFGDASNWLQAMNALPHIQELRLAQCGIVSFPPHNSLLHVNFTSLNTLDLSHNDLNSSVPNWLFNVTSLEQLDLGVNDLNWLDLASISKLTSLEVLDLSNNVLQHGFVRTAFCNLCNLQTLILNDVDINDEIMNLEVVFSGCLMLSLEYLDLYSTRLRGYLPDWLWSMSNLKYLSLGNNILYGPLPASIGSLSSLQYLDISFNHLNGTIPEGILGHMKELVKLYLSGNSLSLSSLHLATLPATLKYLGISSNTLVLNESYESWIPPFQLEHLYMGLCRILPRPHIPRWLQTQRFLSWLDLSSIGVRDTFPAWLPTSIEYLDLSNNEITGHMPHYLLKLMHLDLSNNSLSGQLPSAINNIMPMIRELDLSMNNLTGSIPFSICQIKPLVILVLFQNNFSGKLPNCWKNSTKIIILELSNNKFQGRIPYSLCNMQILQSLHLRHNNLSGQIPTCLKGCTKLIILDLGHNHLFGNIPTWIEENLLVLQVVSLRSNAFTGNISLQLSNLQYLQVLDLSNNNLSGAIPVGFGEFSRMKGYTSTDYSYFIYFYDIPWFFTKRIELQYAKLLSDVTILDLSNNCLSGHIPEEMGNLNLLHSLNLSYNFLTGEIPRNIDGMQQLEALDLSRNNFSGAIPSSLASLNFLSILNLSYNNLSGWIPSGTQLQTFDQSSYLDNPNLCGFPLPNNCPANTAEYDKVQEKDTTYHIEIIWLFTSIALGFITGFWTIRGVLIFQRRWRFALFRGIDNMFDKLYVMIIAVNIVRVRRE